MIKIAVYGKGGIGKSTVTSNLAAAFATLGKRVIQIGCDPKADSTINLMHGVQLEPVLNYMRDHDSNPKIEDIIHTGFGGVLCMETGGPTPGLGCAGRGIIATFQLMDELCSQTSQFKDSSFSKEIDIIENISKVFTFSGTKNENSSSTECGFLQSFSDSDTERIYIKNNSEQKNEIKEQKPQTEVNEEISKESNLNINKEETPSQLNPLNEDKVPYIK